MWTYNKIKLQKPLERVLASDSRNATIKANARFDGWINTESVVFNLKDISGETSQADVFRILLQYARELKDHQYRRVVLAAYGQKKFIIPGDYFQQLGQEFDTQNPIYTLRTFPHHIRAMDGSQTFPEIAGGLFAVLAEEMRQFSDFNARW